MAILRPVSRRSRHRRAALALRDLFSESGAAPHPVCEAVRVRGTPLPEKMPVEVAPATASANNEQVSFREIDAPVVSERTVHRAERVPGWRPADRGPMWRSLCGARVGQTGRGGLFEFEVPVALDPESWRLAANCPACLAAAEKRDLGTLNPL